MTYNGQRSIGTVIRGIAMVCLILAIGFAMPADLLAFTLNVEGCDANNVCAPYTGGFRWIVEEDNTTQSPPGVRVPDSVGLVVHNSHAPVVANGSGTGGSASVSVPSTARYYVSVLPDSGYSISGTMVAAGAGSVTVRVNQALIPTAQVSVLVFKDHAPINNIFDAAEQRIANATILIFDVGGQMLMDAFGNPLGTTYDAGGNVVAMGTGIITTDANGVAFIKNLTPGKYGIRAVPPGVITEWIQTSTIEGTPGIDAWVKANEPPLFIEGFGTGFYHAFIGFVKPAELPWATGGPGANTISGQNVYNHFGRPPLNQGFFAGPPVSECWIGLNDIATGTGLMAVPCDGNSNFSLSGIPDGTYQLATWDKPLDALFGFNTVVVNGGSVNLGQVLSFRWFGTFEGSVFYDANQNGFRDAGETGIMEQNINIRFRDGSIYQAQPTDAAGEYGFAEVFPFFKWLVPEVDFARFKATGMTAAVDYGGAIPPANGWFTPSFDVLNPQPQAEINPNTGNLLSRTETGPVLTQNMMLFLNQTNVIDWGKAAYGPGENGGISGVVFYDTTRAENNPQYNGGEPWQPGIPRVQVCLYRDNLNNATGLPGPDGIIDDINGTPGVQLCDVDNAPFGDFPGPGDVERSGAVGVLDLGDAIDMASTDSFDDNKPTGCIQDLPPIAGVQPCYDNYGTWNQVRPGIFDGGYAFGPNLAMGTYIVESIPPTGYQVGKEEDKNVDFGDEYRVSGLLLPPVCTGTVSNGMPQHIVPGSLALFPGVTINPPLAGSITPLCSMKQISVVDGKNAAADFFFFTEVPKAARVVGFSNNDLSAEFNAGSPVFGEKTSPAWLPVSLQDWQGNEVARVYMDEWGSYNALLPSTFTMNVPMPSGVSPNMITAVLNHPFLSNGQQDPFYDPRYSVTPWTLDYWPGKTTYVDTPLVPIAAFTGYPQNGPDVEPATATPVISAVYSSSSTTSGPVVCGLPDTVTLTSLGTTTVPNPDFDPAIPGSLPSITRDYGFGSIEGIVSLGTGTLVVTNWDNASITVTIPGGTAPGQYQLLVTRADSGLTTPISITLHVLASCANVRYASPGPGAIQAAVDAAVNGDMIVVAPGIYAENVILYKDVKLQGSGAGSTTIFATPLPAERLTAWHAKVQSINGADPFLANEAPGILVLGSVPGFANGPDLIDGFKIMGTIMGGGITVDNNAPGIVISNNRLSGNQGNFGGGITVGAPDRVSSNPGVVIAYNDIVGNGGVQGGGGVVLYAGASNYVVQNNIIGSNFSRFNGGGISHVGLSTGGMIANNKIIFNEVAFGGAAFGDGAGIYIGGSQLLGNLSAGSGSVTINANLIQGNLAGVGSGAGIKATAVNGQDVLAAPGNPSAWHELAITNNMIVNNVAGYAGGGIALQDVARASINNNTIANNDSTATAANAFAAGAVDTTPQGAGIVANVHSALLTAATGSTQTFSNPELSNNIIWSNRSFYTTNGGAGGLVPNPLGIIWDLDVAGTAGQLNPDHSILTNITPAHGGNYSGNGNFSGNPQFVTSYVNTIVTAAVIDEGGNFITVRFTPLQTEAGNYHITSPTSPALNLADAAKAPATDYDKEARIIPDIGADEAQGGDAVPYGSVTINGGGAATRLRNVTLTIIASSSTSTVTNMRLSWDNVTWYGWETYAATRSATIPAGADGQKTIYIQFRDAASTVSPVYSDSITLDTTGPVGTVAINNNAEATSNRNVTLSISATDAAVTVTNMRLSWDGVVWNAWEVYAMTRNATIPVGADGTKTLYIQFRDSLGNVSTTYSDSIVLDRTAPTGSVVINGGAVSTNNRAVVLTLAAIDASSTVTNMRFSWNGTTWYGWEAYATSRNATIPGTTAGTYTIYTQFRDAAGNISTAVNDAINYAP